MGDHGTDSLFAGSIPELYETHLVPLIFEPYAADLVSRLRSRPLARVLEIAAGTGVVTRALEWRRADAMLLPFVAEAFDAVVCQFGVMFFPDRRKAFSEARRVLKPG